MKVSPAFIENMAQKRIERLSRSVDEELKHMYPKRCRVLGDRQLQLFCKENAVKAYKYGASSYAELKSYTFIAWALGVGFDDDPFYLWVQEILEKNEIFEIKMEEISSILFEKHYLCTYEEKDAYVQALNRLLRLNFSTIKEMTSYMQIVETLNVIYPERVKLLGGVNQVKELLKLSCHEKIKRYNIEHPIGIFVYVTLVFFLGHKVDNDPLYPWVSQYLNDDEPRMAYKLDRLVKVITKRVRNAKRQMEKTLEKEVV